MREARLPRSIYNAPGATGAERAAKREAAYHATQTLRVQPALEAMAEKRREIELKRWTRWMTPPIIVRDRRPYRTFETNPPRHISC